MVTSEYFDGVLVTEIIDHGDGTGTRTTYRPDGTVDTVEQLTGLPIPEAEPAEITLADLSAQLAAQNATIEALLNALGGTP